MKKRNQGNTTGKLPEEPKMIKLSLRVSEELHAAVEDLAAARRVSVSNIFRQIAENGLQNFKEGDSAERLKSSLTELERRTTNLERTTQRTNTRTWRSEKILRMLIEMGRDSKVNQDFVWSVLCKTLETSDAKDLKDEAQKKEDKRFKENVDSVIKNEDSISVLRKDKTLK